MVVTFCILGVNRLFDWGLFRDLFTIMIKLPFLFIVNITQSVRNTMNFMKIISAVYDHIYNSFYQLIFIGFCVHTSMTNWKQ